MIRIASVLAMVCFLFSCKTNPSASNENAASDSITTVTYDSLYNHPANYVGKTVTVEGMVTHVCKHGGKRLHLAGTNPETKLVAITGDNIEFFDATLETKDVTLTGIVRETIIDEKYLTEWEQELAAEGDTVTHTDKNHAPDHVEPNAKIKQIRDELKQTGKDHLSEYWIEASAVKAKG